jgi:hypothetical protein
MDQRLNHGSIRWMKSTTFVGFALVMATMVSNLESARAQSVEIQQDQLVVSGVTQPQIWGAEIQYFRLRGGEGRNVPRAKVLEIWNKALDRAVEAKMNAIGFYIPWDFHEYADGKYDFDGTVDEDGDGNPDYPSRDVRTWFKLVEAHGLKNLHVRPGPFINAEWGFLGFGAIPLWFHKKFPNSHMRNPKGQRTPLYTYTDPEFRRYSKRWLEVVYREVIKPYIGIGGLVSFLQIDNETNLMWQSMFNHDYSSRSIRLYQGYLRLNYGGSLTRLNAAHKRKWRDWKEIKAPSESGANVAEDQDWYRFQDETMHQYLHWIRTVWEGLGVREPLVIFTLAESYNAPSEGILPNYKFRNDRGFTGMMTVNLYPKTYETEDITLMNTPFKTDHDVKAADAANDFYFGSKQEWVMGPEIQAGWWKGTHVSEESRRQTYLSVLGHGMKAIFLYYFNEGPNWQASWAKDQIVPMFEKLRRDRRYKGIPEDKLPDSFWTELDNEVANNLFAGWSSKHILWQGGSQQADLYFDAPLDGNADPRAPYAFVREMGNKVMAPYGQFLASAREMTDNVCMLKDVAQHAPSTVPGVNSLIMNSDWAGGLLALLMQAGINPRIVHWNLNPASDLLSCRLIVYQDNGFASTELANALRPVLAKGGGVLSFLDTGLSSLLSGHAQLRSLAMQTPAIDDGCTRLPARPMEVDGTRCPVGGGVVYQARVPIYDVFNTDFYSRVHDAVDRRKFVEMILTELGIEGKMKIRGGGDRIVAFARTSPDETKFWVTVKSGQIEPTDGAIQMKTATVGTWYAVKDVFSDKVSIHSGTDLRTIGFPFALGPSGSTAFFIEPAAAP